MNTSPCFQLWKLPPWPQPGFMEHKTIFGTKALFWVETALVPDELVAFWQQGTIGSTKLPGHCSDITTFGLLLLSY